MVDEPRRAALAVQGRVVLAVDGLQPDVGHEVLWVVRDCLSGQVLLARSLLLAIAADLAGLLREVTAAIGVPVAGLRLHARLEAIAGSLGRVEERGD